MLHHRICRGVKRKFRAAGSAIAGAFTSVRRHPRKWIKRVIRKPGALRADVRRRYGPRGFDRKGRIKPEVLTKLSHEPGKVGQRARFAKRLRKMHHGGR